MPQDWSREKPGEIRFEDGNVVMSHAQFEALRTAVRMVLHKDKHTRESLSWEFAHSWLKRWGDNVFRRTMKHLGVLPAVKAIPEQVEALCSNAKPGPGLTD